MFMKRRFLKCLCLAGVLFFTIPVVKINALETSATEIEIASEMACEGEKDNCHSTYNFKLDKENLKENAKKLPKLKTQKIETEIREITDGDIPIIDTSVLYSGEILSFIGAFESLHLQDYNYLRNYDTYKHKKIEELSLEETLSYLTFIIRGERFCDGHIAYYLGNGTIEKLCNNL